MNKARRHELKMLKYKKRLAQLGLKDGPNCNFTAYRSHGKPCSCFMCSPYKYDRAKEKKRVFEIAIKPHNESSMRAIEYFGEHFAISMYGFFPVAKGS